MADHVLGISALRTDVTVLAAPEAVAPLRRRLDRMLSQRLPPLLAELSAPVLDGRAGVIRLRRLAVDLDVVGPLDETVLARLLAARIAQALGEELAGGASHSDVRMWVDRASFLAAYLETRLGLEHGPDWPFAELRALAVLSPSEAAVEVLRTHPPLLRQLARNGAAVGAPERLLTRLDDRACVALLEALIGSAAAHPRSADDIRGLLRYVGAGPPATGTALPRAALALMLRAIAREPDAFGPSPPVQPAVAVVALRALAPELASALRRPLRAADLSPGLLGLVPALPPPFGAALEEALADPVQRDALTGLLPTRRRRDDPRLPQAQSEDDVAPGPADPASHASWVSPVAGIALLLPGIIRSGAVQALTPRQLRAAALSVLGEGPRAGAADDPLIHRLFPIDPREALSTAPPVTDAALGLVAVEARGLLAGRSDVEGWGDVLLAAFASRLPGLRASTRPYLQRQFLHVPGRLDLSPEQARVTLEGPSLAVVLAMAGLAGDQCTLPHLADRTLTLVLTGLRR